MIARLLALFLAVTSLAQADTPDAILKDYRTRATEATRRLDETLEKQGAQIVTNLVRSGDTAGAETVTTQLKILAAGESVNAPHSAAAKLFAQYTGARTAALQPVQASALARLDSLLKVAGGPKLDELEALTKARAEIEAGKIIAAIKNFLRDNKIPKRWRYYLTAKYDKAQGVLILNDDGTMEIEIPSPSTGTWTPTGDPSILALDIKNAANVPEKTELVIKGTEAILKRVSGMRYLKAD